MKITETVLLPSADKIKLSGWRGSGMGAEITMQSVMRAVRRFLSNSCQFVLEVVKLLWALLIRSAADWLPSRLVRGLAKLLGFLIALSPTEGFSRYRIMKNVFGLSTVSAFVTAQGYLARPYEDSVILRRVFRNREDSGKWKIIEAGSERVQQIKDSRQPFIVSSAHFTREAILGLIHPTVLPYNIAMVVAPLPPRSSDPLVRRIRLQYEQVLDGLRGSRPNDFDYIFTGGLSLDLVTRVRRPGNVLLLAVDAPWEGGGAYFRNDPLSVQRAQKNSIVRPFAGRRTSRFGIGAAVISRLAQCPILPCIPFLRDDGTIVIDWGTPILPPGRKDKDSDIRITNEILDYLERGIGLRPHQYLLQIGESRRWNPVENRWEDPV